MKPAVVIPICICAAALGSHATRFSNVVNPPVRAAGLEAQETHAAASLLGQFRTSISSFLFLRSDLYLHGGVEMRPLTKKEVDSGKKGVGAAADENEKLADDDSIVTVIPGARDDFRGIFGDVERSVASYKDMTGHHHQSPTQTLPLFRLMTWLDPKFIEGWTTGGYVILFDQKPGCIERGWAYLQHGVGRDPDRMDVRGQVACCYLKEMEPIGYKGHQYDKALPYLEHARKIGVGNLKLLTEGEKEALEENYRRLAVCYRELHRYQDMRDCSLEGLQLFGQDGSLRQHAKEAEQLLRTQTTRQ